MRLKGISENFGHHLEWCAMGLDEYRAIKEQKKDE